MRKGLFFMEFILKLAVRAAAVGLTAALLPGVTVAGVWTALLTAITIGLINALIRPIVFVLTLPATILTIGLFSLVINALMIQLADWAIPGFMVNGFWWALLFALVLSVINAILNAALRDR